MRRFLTQENTRAGEGGFSLLLVLLAVVIITLVGTTAVYTSGSDLMAAQAKQRSALARQVAEAGLNHYAAIVQPSWIPNQLPTTTVVAPGEEGEEAPTGFTYTDVLDGLTPFHEQVLPSAPPGFIASYAVWGGAPIDDGAQIIIEGRLAREDAPDRIVGRARISTVVVMTSGSDGYSGTIGWTPRNTGVIGGGEGEGYAGW